MDEVRAALKKIEENRKKFGDRDNPLLVSVRSGAAISMPGMMDTILNLGLNDEAVEGLAKLTGDKRFARDCYRRFIQMFSNVVLDAEHGMFDAVMERYKKRLNLDFDYEIAEDKLLDIINEYKEIVTRTTGRVFPQDVQEQLEMAIIAVFKSWNTPRAKVYRKANKISDELGTAVNIQSMVFGNMGTDSGTGVALPATHRLVSTNSMENF